MHAHSHTLFACILKIVKDSSHHYLYSRHVVTCNHTFFSYGTIRVAHIIPLQNHGKRVEEKSILKEKQNVNQQLIEIVPAYEQCARWFFFSTHACVCFSWMKVVGCYLPFSWLITLNGEKKKQQNVQVKTNRPAKTHPYTSECKAKHDQFQCVAHIH